MKKYEICFFLNFFHKFIIIKILLHFCLQSDQTILDKMAEFETKKERSPFVEIAKIIPYDQRQICNRWRNYLNPKCK